MAIDDQNGTRNAELVNKMTTEFVSAAISRGEPLEGLGKLITSVRSEVMKSLSGESRTLMSQSLGYGGDASGSPTPFVDPNESVFPDYIVCLEDGKRFSTLRRHLMRYYGMTPDDYRQKWNLPPKYPMVAPNYATKRSELAKRIGLGSSTRKPKTEV